MLDDLFDVLFFDLNEVCGLGLNVSVFVRLLSGWINLCILFFVLILMKLSGVFWRLYLILVFKNVLFLFSLIIMIFLIILVILVFVLDYYIEWSYWSNLVGVWNEILSDGSLCVSKID